MTIWPCCLFRFFSSKNETQPQSNHILKLQWEIRFLKPHFWDETLHKKIESSNYIGFDLKTAFRTILDLGKYPN